MLGSWRHKCLLFTLLAFLLLSEASRLPKEYWEQMLPKKLPSPSSAPSKGTNSLTTSSSSTAWKANRDLPSSDGKSCRFASLVQQIIVISCKDSCIHHEHNKFTEGNYFRMERIKQPELNGYTSTLPEGNCWQRH
ncbi:uncharacterized protein LOC133867495 [Alnus glutinosa]|uniref:uncharacterized protein LOC133867495 n=1 Tax=Alnus glutinosa TaxID=3517 RepID=UPI002D769C6E|nr:uncharacterized protein LOC133867495 [Alnus glutinosa]